MGLFDFFKNKWQRETEASVGQILTTLFPGGESDILRDMERLRRLTNGKIPEDKLRRYLSGCKTLLYISRNYNESRFLRSFQIKSDNRINDAEAMDVFAYLAGEAAYMDTLTRLMPGATDPEELKRLFSSGTYNDSVDGAQGPFGTNAANPIPTICARSSIEYLERLRFGGLSIQNNRVGSGDSPVTYAPIDIYKLTASDRDIVTVYLSPYHKKTSSQAPAGFTLA